MRLFYMFDDKHRIVACDDVVAWAHWYQDADRSVAKTELVVEGDIYTVSTTFLGVDHNYIPGDAPVLFETMIWRVVPDDGRNHGRAWLNYQQRYSSWAAAERGHKRAVWQMEDGVILAGVRKENDNG